MTHLEERLGDLLHLVVAPTDPVRIDFETVARGARRRQRRRAAGFSGLAVILVAAGVLAAVIGLGSGRDTNTLLTTGGPPSSAPSGAVSAGGSTAPFLGFNKALARMHDGVSLPVIGSGFVPNQQVEISECPQYFDCGGVVPARTVTANSVGSFSASVTLHAKISVRTGGTASCLQSCFLVAQGLPYNNNTSAKSNTFDFVPPPTGAGPRCSSLSLTAAYAGETSASAGEHSAIVNLYNRSGQACWLQGYPTVQLLKDGGVLPFITEDGGYYVPQEPTLVQLAPGEYAHFAVEKNGCQASSGPAAATLGFFLPVENVWVSLAIPPASGSVGLQYCGTADNVGNTVQVGPITAGGGDGAR